MKRYILFLLLCVTAYFPVNAQSKLGLGIKGGINLATQHSDDPEASVKGLLGYHGGIYANYFLFDFLAIQPEVLVSMKGSQWEDASSDVKDYLSYMEIPVLIRFQPIELINIHAGPQLSYLFLASSWKKAVMKK